MSDSSYNNNGVSWTHHHHWLAVINDITFYFTYGMAHCDHLYCFGTQVI